MRASGKLLPPSSGGGSLKSAALPQATIDEIGRLQQDLVLLTQKVADLSGEPQRAPAAPVLDGPTTAPNSPFVSGLRGMAEGASTLGASSGGALEIKVSMLEKVLKKVAELDRLLLRNTAPEGHSANARRGSRGMDLFSLPTHLHITDRLLDLHTQSKRVITVTTTAAASGSAPQWDPPPQPQTQPQPPKQLSVASAAEGRAAGGASPRGGASSLAADKDAAKKAAAEIASLKSKLEESETKRNAVKEDCAAARKENMAYKKEAADLKAAVESLQLAASQDDREARIKKLEARVSELEAQSRSMQETLEVEISRSERAVEVVSRKAAAIKNNHQEYGNSPQKEPKSSEKADDAQDNLLGQPMAHSLRLLEEALQSRLSGMHDQLLSMSFVKDSLETEVQTLQMAQEVVTKDFLIVQQELDVMRTAHSSLRAESSSGDAALKLERANNLLLDLQAEVAAAHRRTFDLERLPALVAELEYKLRTVETKALEQDGELVVLKGELESYKKMSENLKNKIRELSSKGDSDSKDFMDSFEEVMQDEMYTMKLAFEAKLKCKADEVAALAQRHALEINRIQASSSPYIRR